jgi:TatD DNase family protein
MMFDTHCHLQDQRICGQISELLGRARAAGVGRLLCCGCAGGDWAGVARLGAEHPPVSCAFGVHPWHADKAENGWSERLEEFLRNDPKAAVGEIGLDNAVRPRNDEKQADVFTRQLEIAGRLGRPVSIHCRKAWGSLLSILRRTGGLKYGGAVHSYSGPPDLVGELEKFGCCISFSGSILAPGSKRAAESLKKVSPDKLLVETDSPDILPAGALRPYNEPANLPIILDKAARILGMPIDEVAELTYNNGVRLFGGAS